MTRPIELAESQLIVGTCQCGGFYREHADQEPVAHRPDWVQGQCDTCSDLRIFERLAERTPAQHGEPW